MFCGMAADCPGDIEANIMSLDNVSSTSQLFAMSSWPAILLFLCITPVLLSLSIAAEDVDDEFSIRLDGLSMKIISSAEQGCIAGAKRSRLGKSRSNDSP